MKKLTINKADSNAQPSINLESETGIIIVFTATSE